MRRWLVNGLLVCSSFFFAFVLAELVFTVKNFTRTNFDWYYDLTVPSDNEVLLYELTPNFKGSYEGIKSDINSHGLRDHEYDRHKAPDIYRIAAVGDSITYGFGVDMEASYPKVLERLLNSRARGPRFEVINFGILGYGVVEEAELIRARVLAYDPDLILLGYCLNDPRMSPNPRLGERTTGRCRLYGTDIEISCRVNSVIYSSRVLTFVLGKISNLHYRLHDFYTELYEDETMWKAVTDSFAGISRVSEEAGIPVVLVVFPVIKDVKAYRWTEIHSRIAGEGKKNGFHVIDLLDEFKKYDDEVVGFEYVHPTPGGHRITADHVFQELIDRGILSLEGDHPT